MTDEYHSFQCYQNVTKGKFPLILLTSKSNFKVLVTFLLVVTISSRLNSCSLGSSISSLVKFLNGRHTMIQSYQTVSLHWKLCKHKALPPAEPNKNNHESWSRRNQQDSCFSHILNWCSPQEASSLEVHSVMVEIVDSYFFVSKFMFLS